MLDDYKETQPVVYQILKNSVIKNKNSHAYLFETNGYSKQMDLALAFAKYLLCPFHHSNIDDAKDCSICNRIQDGNFTELKIIEPDGLWIKKEQLSELQKEFSTKSIESNQKVYIINHAEKLNDSSANSILKFLEEPEENIVAILLTDNSYQLLDTIVSRCQVVSFRKDKKIECINNESKTLFLIANQLVDQEDQLYDFINDEKNKEKIDQIIQFIVSLEKYGKETLLFSKKLWFDVVKEKEEYFSAFRIMQLFYQDVLNVLYDRNIEIMEDYKKEILSVLSKNDIITITSKLKILMEEQEKIKYNVNSNLLMDKLIIRMSEVSK